MAEKRWHRTGYSFRNERTVHCHCTLFGAQPHWCHVLAETAPNLPLLIVCFQFRKHTQGAPYTKRPGPRIVARHFLLCKRLGSSLNKMIGDLVVGFRCTCGCKNIVHWVRHVRRAANSSKLASWKPMLSAPIASSQNGFIVNYHFINIC